MTLARTPCPECGKLGLSIEWRLTAKPLTFMLAGSQLVARGWRPWLLCRACGLEVEGQATEEGTTL